MAQPGSLAGQIEHWASIGRAVEGLLTSSDAICQARDGISALQEKVKFADLDISKPAGAGALYFRIASAAGEVCPELDHGDLSSKLIFHRCVRQAIANALAEVDPQALYSVYNAKNPAPKPVMLAAAQRITMCPAAHGFPSVTCKNYTQNQ
jgi:UrcA family protein